MADNYSVIIDGLRSPIGLKNGALIGMRPDDLTAEVVKVKAGGDIVNIGSTIIVNKEGKDMEFTIVGSTEANPSSGKISVDSPLGQTFLNKKIGEICQVELPGGIAEYKIVKIS